MNMFIVVATVINTVVWIGVARLMGSRIDIAHQRIDVMGKRLDAQHTTLKLLVDDAIGADTSEPSGSEADRG